MEKQQSQKEEGNTQKKSLDLTQQKTGVQLKPLFFTLSEIMEKKIEIKAINKMTPGFNCQFCGSSCEPTGLKHPFEMKVFYWQAPSCTCEKGREFYEKERAGIDSSRNPDYQNESRFLIQSDKSKLIKESLLGERFLTAKFKNFKVTEDNKKAYGVATGYVSDWLKGKKRDHGLIIIGPVGTGKTHLAAALANNLLHSDIPVIMATLIKLLDTIKVSWRAENSLSEDELLEKYSKVPLLVIDDLGKERFTEWSLERFYSIINNRYENKRPVIITTNFNKAELVKRLSIDGNDSSVDAILSRIYGMCQPVLLNGEDWRRK